MASLLWWLSTTGVEPRSSKQRGRSRATSPPVRSTRTLSTSHSWPVGSTPPSIPDPDLLVRTSGEMRVSNFLLWQIAYSEIWVTPTLWPDFGRADLLRAVLEYQKRDRRFGGR